MAVKIAILGYYGFGNAGDEAVLDGLLPALRQAAADRGVDIGFTVLSADPAGTRSRCEVDAVDRWNAKAVFAALYGCDALLVGGGSLFQDVTGRGFSVAYYSGLVFLAAALGKKIVFYAQGVGPVRAFINRKLVRMAAGRASFLSVRDGGSLFELRSMGVTRQRIYMTADPSFALAPDKLSEAVKRVLQALPDKPLLGIMLREWAGMDKCIGEVAAAADSLAKRLGMEIVAVPMQSSVDLPVCRRLASLMRTHCHVVEDDDLSPADMPALFERFALVLGMRLHSLIFAAGAGVPMMGIRYDPKVNDFLEQIGMPLAANLDDIKAERLVEQGIKLWDDRIRINKMLLAKAEAFKQQAFETAGEALDAVLGGK